MSSLYRDFRVVLTDSGTSALALAIQLSAGSENRPVALPAYGCYDLATAAAAAQAPFVLYDIDPDTLGPSETSLGRALAAGADRVVVAHLYGHPVDMQMVNRLAEAAGAVVVDDAAQAAGASYNGSSLGGLGSLGVLSFGRGKGITGGGGGALLVRDDLHFLEEPARRILGAPKRSTLRELGSGMAQWLFGRPSLYALPMSVPGLQLGETVYHEPRMPTRPTAFNLGVLRASLLRADTEAARRRVHAHRLSASTTGTSLVAPRVPRNAVPGFLRLALVASPAKARAADTQTARRRGIMRGYPRSLCDLEGFGIRRDNRRDRFDGARLLAERLITLPVHSLMTEADLLRVEAWCNEFS